MSVVAGQPGCEKDVEVEQAARHPTGPWSRYLATSSLVTMPAPGGAGKTENPVLSSLQDALVAASDQLGPDVTRTPDRCGGVG
jgi:hypothetical protein